jgi:deoxyribodipyrimidine photo-lyase
MSDVTLLWFKKDLRLHDHPAFALAGAEGARVVPIYIVEPDLWRQPDASARQYAFLAESLAELQQACVAKGAALLVRMGDAVEVLDGLRRELGIGRLVSHEETGNGWTLARDLRVAAWARAKGVVWQEVPQSGVVRRLKSRDGWAARRGRFLRQALAKPPGAFWAGGLDPGVIPSARALGLPADPCPARQPGGRAAGLALLDSFLISRGRSYRRAMSSPLAGELACSRLSPHLAFGTVSGREAAQAAARHRAAGQGRHDGWAGSLASFGARLAWRDHFMQKLEDAPEIERMCLHPAYEGLRPRMPDAPRLAAWSAGETGLPFVDACMRYLAATGWLNFRMRSMLMAVASYHLWLDWRPTGLHLARRFTDYEPGIHWPQVQMQSGTTGMNTVRIYNPVKQGHDQDPDGVFTRRWVPELALVPDRFLQAPWLWPEADRLLDRTYPAPIVDVASAAAAARDRVWAVRRGPAFRVRAEGIVARHGSRKRDAGFVNDRQPRLRRQPPADDRQLGFDL